MKEYETEPSEYLIEKLLNTVALIYSERIYAKKENQNLGINWYQLD